MTINRQKLDNILMQLRVEMLEITVLRLSVFMRASGLTTVHESAARAALQRTEAELQSVAQGLEKATYEDPKMGFLTAEERALLADEFREMVEHTKTTLRSLYPDL